MIDFGLDVLFVFLSLISVTAFPHYFGNPKYIPLTKREHAVVAVSVIGLLALFVFHY